ncbi:MAG: SDR family oxidoreductase [Bryobacteraceae bacterium]|nr:SDR family oxidoreductase [Bryobacteraceae bacterium]
MRVLVTGAQGCIGSWVVRQLLERGIDVVMYDLDANPRRLAMIAGDACAAKVPVEIGAIQDTARLKAIVREGGITHIIHLAAVLMPFCQANPVEGGMINVIGTLNVFEAARDAGRPVRIAYASSAAVWGPDSAYEDRPLTEADPLKPATHYGVFKATNEESARVFYSSNGISSVGLRPWTVYGVGRDSGLTADPTLAMQAVARRMPFQIRLSGPMDLQYVRDVAETFIRCVLSPIEGAYTFNLAGDIATIDEIVAMLRRIRPEAADLITSNGPRVPVAFKMDDAALRRYVPDIPKTAVEDGVRETIESFERLQAEGRLN